MPEIKIPKKLKPLLKPKRYKVVIGGRGSGKSMTVADLCLLACQTQGIKTACFREYQNSIEDSVYSLLKSEICRLNLDGFNVQARSIDYGGEPAFVFKGLARNVQSIKSMHGFGRAWVEEAQTLSQESLEILTPTCREAGSEIWFTGNPGSSADPFSQRFIVPYLKHLERDGYYEDDDHIIIWANYYDNPFFPAVLEEERHLAQERLSTAEYEHIWLGKFNDKIDNALIQADWFDAAVDAHKKLNFGRAGLIVSAHDPSDEGDDDKGYAARHGSVVISLGIKETGDVIDGLEWAMQKAREDGADCFLWDADGMGVALKRDVEAFFERTRVQFEPFRGGSGVEDAEKVYAPDSIARNKMRNKDLFKNKRAQYYWRLRERFFNTYRAIKRGEKISPEKVISLPGDLPYLQQLRAELCRIPLKPTANGQIQIMAKDEMRKIGIPSPNLADSLMMTMHEPRIRQTVKPINYIDPGIV